MGLGETPKPITVSAFPVFQNRPSPSGYEIHRGSQDAALCETCKSGSGNGKCDRHGSDRRLSCASLLHTAQDYKRHGKSQQGPKHVHFNSLTFR